MAPDVNLAAFNDDLDDLDGYSGAELEQVSKNASGLVHELEASLGFTTTDIANNKIPRLQS